MWLFGPFFLLLAELLHLIQVGGSTGFLPFPVPSTGAWLVLSWDTLVVSCWCVSGVLFKFLLLGLKSSLRHSVASCVHLHVSPRVPFAGKHQRCAKLYQLYSWTDARRSASSTYAFGNFNKIDQPLFQDFFFSWPESPTSSCLSATGSRLFMLFCVFTVRSVCSDFSRGAVTKTFRPTLVRSRTVNVSHHCLF